MDYDKVSDWEQDNIEELQEQFIEKYQDLWGQFVLERFEEAYRGD